MVEVLWIYPPPTPVRMVCMVRLAVEELIERLEITVEVLKTQTNVGGVETLIEGVELAKSILKHYAKPFIYTNSGDFKKHIDKLDRPEPLNSERIILDYVKIGIISDALRNYLLRLGWSYKDKEIFTLVLLRRIK